MAQTLAHRRRLKERVTLPDTPATTDVGGGAVQVTDVPGETVRARVRPLKGREYLMAKQTVGGTPYEVTLRRPLPEGSTLTAADRITWHSPLGDKTLSLESPPAPVEGEKYIRFIAVWKEES